MSVALKTLKKVEDALDHLNGIIRSFMEKAADEASKEVSEEVVESSEAEKEYKELPSTDGEVKVKVRKTGVNRSDLIREYFRKHGIETKNKDLIAGLEKAHNIKVDPSLVSTIRKKIQENKTKPSKKAIVKAKSVPKGDLKGLPMPATVVAILKRPGAREGLKLKDITVQAIEGGYEYNGKKGNLGIAQNVYQALHNLAQKKSHPGFNGKVAVVLHDDASKRWRINPKASKARKTA